MMREKLTPAQRRSVESEEWGARWAATRLGHFAYIPGMVARYYDETAAGYSVHELVVVFIGAMQTPDGPEVFGWTLSEFEPAGGFSRADSARNFLGYAMREGPAAADGRPPTTQEMEMIEEIEASYRD